MKKYIAKIFLFFIIVALIDVIFGMGCDYLYKNSKGGDTYKINYAISEGTADVLIMGSSRACHHYNPQIFSDSLNMSVYNLGIDGSGVILADGFYRLLSKRYIPKYIIYELTPQFDLYENASDQKNTRYLAQLKPYSRDESLSEIFNDINPKEILKLHSGLYRYNTSFFNLIRFFYQNGELNGNEYGYEPLNGKMIKYEPGHQLINNIDTLKIKYLHRLIADCKRCGTQLIFVVSPKYLAHSADEFKPGIDIFDAEHCILLNHLCDSSFIFNSDLFKDSYHLNSDGADLYTRTIIKELKNICMK